MQFALINLLYDLIKTHLPFTSVIFLHLIKFMSLKVKNSYLTNIIRMALLISQRNFRVPFYYFNVYC
jgi:hypothetical protein